MAEQYYCFYTGDYQRDTGDLTLLEHGAYRVLLDHYYMQGSLPCNKHRLSRICRAFTPEEQAAVDMVVNRFFTVDGEFLRNKRADKEIAKRKVFVEKMSARGKAGAKAKWEKDAYANTQAMAQAEPQAEAQAMPEQCLEDGIPSPSPSPSPSPIPKPIEDLKEPVPDVTGLSEMPTEEQIENQSSVQTDDWINKISGELSFGDSEGSYLWPKVYAFVNTCKKKGCNNRAILHTLTRCLIAKPDDPWAYCVKIMAVEDQNFNERDYQKVS